MQTQLPHTAPNGRSNSQREQHRSAGCAATGAAAADALERTPPAMTSEDRPGPRLRDLGNMQVESS